MEEQDLLLKIAFCDDQHNVLVAQCDLIAQILNERSFSNYQLMTFSNAEAYLNTEETFDLLFLDIEMPAIDGFNLADELKKRQTETKIIYVSSMIERTKDSLKHQAFRFLEKPLQKADVVEALEAFLEYQSETQVVLISENQEIRSVSLNQIVYIESVNKQSEFYFSDDSCFVDQRRLKYWREKLTHCPFFYRGSKIHIINLNQVIALSVQSKEIEFQFFSLPLSRREFRDLKNIMLSRG